MKKIVSFIVCGLLVSTFAFAQSPKLGYINAQELLQLMPEIRKADSSLQLYAKSFQDQLQAMSAEFQKKSDEYQAGAKTMSDAVREVKEKELMDLRNRLESTNQSAQEKVAKKKDELTAPILEKADKAVKEVAKEKGYDYIFDSGNGNIIYGKETDNILPLVKAKLGIK